MIPVAASSIQQGEFFRKRTGSYVYLRLAVDSLRYHRVEGHARYVYGACYNGNVTAVDPTTLVVRCAVQDFLKNIAEEQAWERDVGVLRSNE